MLEYCCALSLQLADETEALAVSFSFTSAELGASPREDAGEMPEFEGFSDLQKVFKHVFKHHFHLFSGR